jgi:hypothetical protein
VGGRRGDGSLKLAGRLERWRLERLVSTGKQVVTRCRGSVAAGALPQQAETPAPLGLLAELPSTSWLGLKGDVTPSAGSSSLRPFGRNWVASTSSQRLGLNSAAPHNQVPACAPLLALQCFISLAWSRFVSFRSSLHSPHVLTSSASFRSPGEQSLFDR